MTAVFCWQVPFLSFPGALDRAELEMAYKTVLVDAVSAIVPAPAVPLWTVVAEGDPAMALIQAAGDADLLVLGTRGRPASAGLSRRRISGDGAVATSWTPRATRSASQRPCTSTGHRSAVVRDGVEVGLPTRHRLVFVPLDQATVGAGCLKVGYARKLVRDAPRSARTASCRAVTRRRSSATTA